MSSGTATPTAKAAVSSTAGQADPVAGAHQGDGGEHGTGAGHEDEAEAQPEDEPARFGVLAPAAPRR